MRLFKEKRKILSSVMIAICVFSITGCGKKVGEKRIIDPEKMNKERTNLLENADIDDSIIQMMYYDGEKTETRYVDVDKEKEFYDEISNLKIKPIPLGKVSEIKTPCFGISAGNSSKYGDIELTYYDGMWLRGTIKNVGTEENIKFEYEYELYEADYDYKSAFDKYMMVEEETEEEDDDSEELNISKGGFRMPNAMLLCNYNVKFYQEVDEEIPSEREGVSISDVDLNKDDEIAIELKNEGHEEIRILGWSVQKKVEDKWFILPTNRMYSENAVGKILADSEEETFKHSIKKYEGLGSGKYRVVQEYSINSGDYKVAREFDID